MYGRKINITYRNVNFAGTCQNIILASRTLYAWSKLNQCGLKICAFIMKRVDIKLICHEDVASTLTLTQCDPSLKNPGENAMMIW